MAEIKIKTVKKWVLEHRLESVLVFLIIGLGAFFRFYRISEYMTFLGDEGRDAIIVRRLLVNFDPILIGPGTSIGNMYLGPWYYYLIAPALFFSNFSPVGPSALVALLGTITIGLVWWISREWFLTKTRDSLAVGGLLVAFLYAISPTMIIFAKSSWNPNVMPFFALVFIYGIWKVWRGENYKWLFVVGISLAMALNSHYLGLLLVPIGGLFWLMRIISIRKEKKELRTIVWYSLVSLVIFLIMMSPLLIFDMRHGWINSQAIVKFFLERQTTVSIKPWKALPFVWPLIITFCERLVAGRDHVLGVWTAVGIAGGVSWLFIFQKKQMQPKAKRAFYLLLVWLGVSVVGLGVYKQHIYDHYFGFFFPVLFLIMAGIFQYLYDNFRTRGMWIILVAGIFLTYFNLKSSPLIYPPNRQMQRAEAVARKIREIAGESKFNLAVVAERNYEDGYQYFLEKWGLNISDIDPLNFEATIADQLFVVCEKIPSQCDPTHNPKAEVANFGWSKIDDQWQVMGITVYRLVHLNEENNK